jgi:RNA polymerase sigma factor (TIGR02999 family)
MSDVTRLLEEVRQGDRGAVDRLLVAVYDELRQLAARKLAHERPGQTLQATALVHEAYLRLLGDAAGRWENSAHFFMAAAEAMRRILVESARRKARLKRGGGRPTREVDEADAIVTPDSLDVVALDEALEKLAGEDPVKAQLVKLRYFCGLTVEEAGRMLGISRATADRYWAFARAWLCYEIEKGDEPP